MIDIGRNIELNVLPLSPSIIKGAFKQQECEQILSILKDQSLLDYHLEKRAKFSATVLPYEDKTAWVYGKLYDLAIEINQSLYKFKPIDMVEHIWYQVYYEGDYAKWKTEMNEKFFANRKIAMVVNLSTSDEYRGGEFLINDGSYITVPRGLGDVIVFPGYLLNQIETIIAGEKKVIVAWFGGTHLK